MDLTTPISCQTLALVTCMLIPCVIRVYSQPLHLPAQSFSCGSSGVKCERWGFDACVSPDGEFYCLPCSQEYLKTLCGTTEEIPGCNLYCTKLAVDKETEKLHSEFSKRLANLQLNFSDEKADLQSRYAQRVQDLNSNFSRENATLQRKLYLQENRSFSLEREIDEQENILKKLENERTVLRVMLGVSTLFGVTGTIYFIICRRKCRKNQKTCVGELPEKSALLAKNESPVGLFTSVDETQRASSDTSENAVVYNKEKQVVESANVTQDGRSLQGNCPAYDKLVSVPPTQQPECDKPKIAINGQVHDRH